MVEESPVTVRKTCRLCGASSMTTVLELDPIPLSENYSDTSCMALKRPRFPISLQFCNSCSHVQIPEVIRPEVLWDSYSYRSGWSSELPEHFEEIYHYVSDCVGDFASPFMVDIGSNDGSLMVPFLNRGWRTLGVDPVPGLVAEANAAGRPTIESLFTSQTAEWILKNHGPAHVVTAFNVFAHADDLSDMTKGIARLLAPSGIFVFEAQYLVDVVEKDLLATVFHEHMSHHSVTALKLFFEEHDLELVDVTRYPIQHGSVVGVVQRKGAERPVKSSVREILDYEETNGISDGEAVIGFARRVAIGRRAVKDWVSSQTKLGKKFCAYGAARSGPTLIAQFGLKGVLDFVLDDHPDKVGKFESGDGLEVVPTCELVKRNPDFAVILAWVHADRIIEKNQTYLDSGGSFVVLSPTPRVVSANESKTLVGDLKVTCHRVV